MLQSIRDHTQGWIAGTIVSLLILSFALWGIHSYINSGASNTTVAKVNGVEISRGQLAVAYERLRRQVQMQFSSSYQLPEQAEAALKDRALQALINIQVLKQASLSHNYRISSAQIDSFLENMPEFQVNGQFSAARFQQILETTLFNVRDFLDLIKTSLLIDQPRLGFIFTSFALPNEIIDNIALVNQERNIQYVTLPLDLIAKQPMAISKDDIQAYYKQHQDEFKTPEQVSIEYIVLSLKDLMASIHPTDEALKNFYNENSSSYTLPMQWKLESVVIPVSESANDQEVEQAQKKAHAIFDQANSGKDFSALNKENALISGDKKLQGFVTINQIPAELQKSILALTKRGQVSNPIRINSGFIIFKADEIKEPIVQDFAQVKDKIKDAMIRQHAEEKLAEMREKLSSITYEHPDSLEPAAKALGLTIKTTGLFTKEMKGKNDDVITSNLKVRQAAFSNDVLNSQNNSDVIQINGDDALVLRVKTHAPATLLSLDTVEKQIIDKLKTVEVNRKAEQLANDIKQKLDTGANLNQAAQQYHLTWKQVGFIGRHSDKINSAILDTAFAMPKSQDSNKQTFAVAKVPEGYAVIALSGVRDGVVNPNDHKQYQVYAEQIQNTQGLMEYELYKQSLTNQAKIAIDN